MRTATSASKALEFGAQWEGETVNGKFPLQRYLGGSKANAVFLTELREPDRGQATIELVAVSSCDPNARLADWQKAAKLSHPNLLRIYDAGRCRLADNDLLFIVTEYAEENLEEVLQRRPLDSSEGHLLLRPALDVLAYLHKQGLVHGHLRPSNVMAAEDQLKISSDCIRATGQPTEQSEFTIYDAPEIRTGPVNPSADVWSLGATLSAAMSQHAPGKPAQTKQNGSNGNLPEPFADVVSHCLRENPADRWTVSDIVTRIQAPVERPRVAPRVDLTSLPQPRNNRRLLTWMIAGVVGLILVAFYAMTKSSPSGQSQTAQPQNAQTEAQAAPASATNGSSSMPGEKTAGAVLSQVAANPSQSALRTIHGRIKVHVRVSVDQAGNVTNARLTTPGPSKYFARLAMDAAQKWKFTAPRVNGKSVRSEWNVLFEFANNGTQASAQPIS